METKDLIAGLAARAEQLRPPTGGKPNTNPSLDSRSAGEVNTLVRELQSKLGLPVVGFKGNKLFGLQLLATLEQVAATRDGASPPAAAALPVLPPAAPPAAAARATATPATTVPTAMLAALCRRFSLGHVAENLPESERRLQLAACFFRARLEYPGSAADFARLPAGLPRTVPDAKFGGALKTRRAFAQQMLDREIEARAKNESTRSAAPAAKGLERTRLAFAAQMKKQYHPKN